MKRRELMKIKLRRRDSTYRRVMNNLNKMPRDTKLKMNEKDNKKIEYLRQKFREKEDEPEIPDVLEEK